MSTLHNIATFIAIGSSLVATGQGAFMLYAAISVHRGNNTFSRFLRRQLVSDMDISNKLISHDSYFASTVITVDKDDEPLGGTVRSASARANEFDGKDMLGNALIGQNGKDLLLSLSDWMDSSDFTDLKDDQINLYNRSALNSEIHAKIPIRFNSTHPKHPNGVFLPIVVSTISAKKPKETRIFHVIYLDLKVLPPAQ